MRSVISLGTIKDATGHEAVTRYLEEQVLPGSDWNLVKVRRKSVRLEPPFAYWASYVVKLGRGELVFPEPDEEPILETTAAIPTNGSGPAGAEVADVMAEAELPQPSWTEERELRLVARGIFDTEQWVAYRDRIAAQFRDHPTDPLSGSSRPAIFEDTQHCIWFFPTDPNMTSLHRAADPLEMRRIFRNRKGDLLDYPGRITEVKVELARYLPEIAAIIRYDIETVPQAAAKTIFGKVQPFKRGEESHRVMTEIWKAAQRSDGRLVVPRPLGYFADLGLYLQSSVPGKPISSDRTKPEFLPGVIHAAEALATLHESSIPTQKKLPLEHEIARLERTLDQFALVHPKAYFLLRELLAHLREKLKNLPEDEWLPTHGDYKYDQLLHEDGHYSLIDFDFFALAETSFDLGKFCAYLTPSMPKGWEQSVAAEEARKAFLDRYRELRPDATLGRFPVYETTNLAGRAMTMMWTQTRGWDRAAEALLVIGMERLKSRLP
jgi:plasmid stabilization system protein ParE